MSQLDAMLDAAEETPFDANEHGLWCPVCGWLAAPPWFFDRPDYEPPDRCGECGWDGEGHA